MSELESGTSKAADSVKKLGDEMAKQGEALTVGLTAPLAAVGAAAVAAVLKVGAFADELLDLVDQTGLSTAALQEFRHVAVIAGVDSDTLANAAIKLTTGLQASGEQSKQLAGAVGRLGISLKDANGELRPMEELLPSIIGRLQGVQDVTTRNALAADIFGKSWKDMAPILGLGAGAMEDARKRAHELGLVLSSETVQAADDFRIKVDVLKEVLGALTNRVGSAIIEFAGLHPAISASVVVVGGLVAAVGPLLLMGGKLVVLIPKLKLGFALLSGPIGLAILAVGALTAAGVQMVKHWTDVKLRMALVWGAIKNAVFSAIDFILEGLEKLTRFIPGLNTKIKDMRAEFEELADRSMARTGEQLVRLEDSFLDIAEAMDVDADATTVLTGKTDKLAEAIKALTFRHSDYVSRLAVVTESVYTNAQSVGALQRAQNLLEGSITDTTAAMAIYKGLVGDVDAAENTFKITQDALNTLLKEGRITQDQYNEALRVATERTEELTRVTKDELNGSLSDVLKGFQDLGIKVPESLEGLAGKVEGAWGRISAVLTAPATLNQLKTDWIEFFNNVAEAVTTFWSAIKGIADKVSTFFLDIGGASQNFGPGGLTLNVGGGGGAGGGVDASPLLIQWVHESRAYQLRTAGAAETLASYAPHELTLLASIRDFLVGISLTLTSIEDKEWSPQIVVNMQGGGGAVTSGFVQGSASFDGFDQGMAIQGQRRKALRTGDNSI